MVIQGFLSRDLEESEMIGKTYPNIIRWAIDVDTKSLELTLKRFNIVNISKTL